MAKLDFSWKVISKDEAENGLKCNFRSPDCGHAHTIEVCQTIGVDEWNIVLFGYEDNLVRVADGIVGMRNALEAAEEMIEWILSHSCNFVPFVEKNWLMR